MSKGLGIQGFVDSEGLLRKFDPSRPPSSAHIVIDEGAEPLCYVLTAGAIRLQDDGCSVSREQILAEFDLTYMTLVEGTNTGIARTTKGQIDGFVRSNGGTDHRPFKAIESPIVRGPEEEVQPTDLAHASIVSVECGLSKTQCKIAVRDLAKTAFDLIHGLD